MTLFEYLTAAHTLILTFAVTRVLSGIADAVRPGRRYWVHLSWLGLAVAFCLSAFWAFWSYLDTEWTMPRFIGVLLPGALIYVYGSIIVPPHSSTIESWRDYYFEKRTALFSTGILLITAILFSNQFILGVSSTHPTQIPLYAMLVVLPIGLASSDSRVHTGLALAPPVGFAAGLISMIQPGSLNL